MSGFEYSNPWKEVLEDEIEKIPQNQTERLIPVNHITRKSFENPWVLRDQKRSCQHEWFKKYPWLDFDVTSDSATWCHFCIHQNSLANLKAELSRENTFLDKDSDNWKKNLSRFDEHQ